MCSEQISGMICLLGCLLYCFRSKPIACLVDCMAFLRRCQPSSSLRKKASKFCRFSCCHIYRLRASSLDIRRMNDGRMQRSVSRSSLRASLAQAPHTMTSGGHRSRHQSQTDSGFWLVQTRSEHI
ncbi:hypothetical protein BV25DRAFT_1709099 [Artomyces pyxidatus]|uniref:Uncharacterized protein n=1 Tax=Artomyces pyxidatus TaxID=48021 RepID=A0ACB8TBR2_9AGAM|nr:hypothetical protein BV25DRAFT_1709099 [Artomyces pyxidatus]